LTGGGNSYSGGTTIDNGVLQIGDGATNAGSLPGNVVINSSTPGALTFNSGVDPAINFSPNYSIGAAAALLFNYNGTPVMELSNDGIQVTGEITFSGNLIAGSAILVDSSGNVLLNGNAPASSSASGIAGRIQWDANYIYICTATATWKRAALSTF